MAKTAIELSSAKVGDILTLSDIQVIEDYDTINLDLIIKEKRTYKEPDGVFSYTAYIAEPDEKEPRKYMVMLRQVGDIHDLMIWTLDMEGDVSEFLGHLVTEDGKDLQEHFSLDVEDDKGKDIEVNWLKRNNHTYFGVRTTSTDGADDSKTVAEYSTVDEESNPDTFVEWTGTHKKGWVELWYGHSLHDSDVELTPTTNEEE